MCEVEFKFVRADLYVENNNWWFYSEAGQLPKLLSHCGLGENDAIGVSPST